MIILYPCPVLDEILGKYKCTVGAELDGEFNVFIAWPVWV